MPLSISFCRGFHRRIDDQRSFCMTRVRFGFLQHSFSLFSIHSIQQQFLSLLQLFRPQFDDTVRLSHLFSFSVETRSISRSRELWDSREACLDPSFPRILWDRKPSIAQSRLSLQLNWQRFRTASPMILPNKMCVGADFIFHRRMIESLEAAFTLRKSKWATEHPRFLIKVWISISVCRSTISSL